ncbi:hypothetical protein HY229_08875 [Candidatus Acetothermia bacterium]|nr:hypothetical protein [Candidatus Acetothermia bacterium]MBI3644194.1 hypothetical protein [Candidatus Acetothermia bacterium]
MIEVEIRRDPDDRVLEIHCFSSELAEESEEGKLVEVSLSTLMKAAFIGLKGYLRLSPFFEDEDGRVILKLKRDHLLNREIDAILETVLLSLRAMQEQHPGIVEIKDAATKVNV